MYKHAWRIVDSSLYWIPARPTGGPLRLSAARVIRWSGACQFHSTSGCRIVVVVVVEEQRRHMSVRNAW